MIIRTVALVAVGLAGLNIGCSSNRKNQAQSPGAGVSVFRRNVLQWYPARHVELSGPEMQIRYSGFLADGRFFVATQHEDADSGECLVVPDENVRQLSKLPPGTLPNWVVPKRKLSAGVIYLVRYAGEDGSESGAYWEIVQRQRENDRDFTVPSKGEESCSVDVRFHTRPE